MARAVPEATGLRVKLPWPVRVPSFDDYRQAIRGLGEVISALREAPAVA